MFFPTLFNIAKSYRGNADEALKPSRQQPEMKKKDTMNENIIYLLKYTLLFYEVMGRKTRTVNHRFQVHAGSCPP